MTDAGWRHTARPEWSTPGESMWMRLAKFSLCNRLSFTALATLFGVKGDSASGVDLRRAGPWKLPALAAVLEITDDDVRAGFCVAPLRLPSSSVLQQLRYCPACLEAGFHAAWFQLRLVERCPLHRLPLQMGCVRCTTPIPYVLGPGLASYPLSCASCGCAWVPGLSRRAGRCTPLARGTSRLFARWARYVEHVVDEENLRRRSRWPGPVALPSPASRPHHLTMVNRVFDAPPPLTAQLLRRCHHHHRVSLRPEAAAEHCRPGYDLSNWPHFDGHFLSCEHALHGARRQLFAAIHDECERGRWRHLLASDLVAPSDAMDSATAAALGWAVAWTSAVGALAPGAARPMPAFGLATWLAGLPLRPSRMPNHRWHSQVLRWLGEDIELSAWIWTRIAGFMRAKGVYLLHGAMAPPADLARLRCERPSGSVIFTSNIR